MKIIVFCWMLSSFFQNYVSKLLFFIELVFKLLKCLRISR